MATNKGGIKIKNYIDLILNMDLFNDLTREKLEEAFEKTNYKLKSYSKNEIIHINNEVCNTMDIILEGEISVQKIDREGNIFKVAVFANGDIVGANLLFSNHNKFPMTIVAETNTLVLHIYKDMFLKLGRENSDFMLKLLTIISDKTLILSNKINAISLKTIRQKVIEILKYEHLLQKSYTIKLNMSKKELAERLGVHRSSLGRELNKMRKDGLIDYDINNIIIKDKEILDR